MEGFGEFIETFLRESDYADSTQECYRYALNRLSTWLETNGLTIEQLSVENFRLLVKQNKWSNNSARSYAAGARAFLKWLVYTDHPLLRMKLPKDDAKAGRSLELPELDKLLAIHNTFSKEGWRNVAMISLMSETGLRATEVCRLRLRDLDLGRHRLDAFVKNRRWREARLSDDTVLYMAKWLEIRPSVAKPDCPYLFVSVKGKRPGTQMTRDGLRANFRRYGLRADIGRLSPHDMRRTMATLFTEAGAPAGVVQEFGDWGDIRMVQRYTRNLKPGQVDRYSPISKLAAQIRSEREDS